MWKVNVQFIYRKDKSNKNEVFEEYSEFKARMIRGISSCKEVDFDDKHLSFSHTCRKPIDVLEYFTALNPVEGSDDIYKHADLAIVKNCTCATNKTVSIMTLNKGGENNERVQERSNDL